MHIHVALLMLMRKNLLPNSEIKCLRLLPKVLLFSAHLELMSVIKQTIKMSFKYFAIIDIVNWNIVSGRSSLDVCDRNFYSFEEQIKKMSNFYPCNKDTLTFWKVSIAVHHFHDISMVKWLLGTTNTSKNIVNVCLSVVPLSRCDVKCVD